MPSLFQLSEHCCFVFIAEEKDNIRNPLVFSFYQPVDGCYSYFIIQQVFREASFLTSCSKSCPGWILPYASIPLGALFGGLASVLLGIYGALLHRLYVFGHNRRRFFIFFCFPLV